MISFRIEKIKEALFPKGQSIARETTKFIALL